MIVVCFKSGDSSFWQSLRIPFILRKQSQVSFAEPRYVSQWESLWNRLALPSLSTIRSLQSLIMAIRWLFDSELCIWCLAKWENLALSKIVRFNSLLSSHTFSSIYRFLYFIDRQVWRYVCASHVPGWGASIRNILWSFISVRFFLGRRKAFLESIPFRRCKRLIHF